MKGTVLTTHMPLGGARRDAREKALIALEAFIGLTAAAGGLLLMARPDGSLLQIPPAVLAAFARTSPFSDFFVPGLLLAGIVGGMMGAALLLVQHRPAAREAAMAAGAALVVFEIVEFATIGFMPLQSLEGAVGLAVLGLAIQRRRANRRRLG